MSWLDAVIIAIVEGITEFLPISSTGHMIIAQKLLGIRSTDFVKLFTVSIQLGAILSVVILYWKKFVSPVSKSYDEENRTKGLKRIEYVWRFYLRLFVAFIPSAIFGLIFKGYIDALLEDVFVVSLSLLFGGIVLLYVDKWFKKPSENQKITYFKAFKIGMFQVISMIPGISRSAATIIGGLQQRLSRRNAAQFSFFLAVPTMAAATFLELLDTYKSINSENIWLLVIGNVVAFIVATIAIKGFVEYLTKHGFKVFGYYRIIVGSILLILIMLNVELSVL